MFTIPLLLIYAFAVCAVAFGRRRLRQGLPISYQARMGVFRNSFRYVLVYIMCVLLGAGGRPCGLGAVFPHALSVPRAGAYAFL